MAFYGVKYNGSGPNPVHSHTMTFCRDKVIFFGGTDGEAVSNDLYFFDLSVNHWIKQEVANPDHAPAPRFSHIAHYVSTKNSFLVFSGTDSHRIFNDMHILNMSTSTWRRIGDRGNQPFPRYGSLSFFLNSGVLIVIAGNGGSEKVSDSASLSDVTAYNVSTNEWVPVKSENQHPEIVGNNLLGVMTPDEEHIIVTGKTLFSVHVLNLEKMLWSQHSAEGFAPTTRVRTPMTLLGVNQAMFFGGVEGAEVMDDAYILDFKNFEFEWSLKFTRGVKPTGLMGHTLTNLGNSLLLFGGTNRRPIDNKKLVCFNDMYLFDPMKGIEWERIPQSGSPPAYRLQHVMVDVPEQKKIFIHGGDCLGVVSSDIFTFNYQENEWESIIPNQIIPLAGHSAAYNSQDKHIYMYGGGDLTESYMYTYKISTNDWQIKKLETKKTPPPRVGQHCFFYKGLFYSYGGFVGKSGILNELLSFDTESLTWEHCTYTNEEESHDLPKPTLAFGALIKSNLLYIICGIAYDDVSDQIFCLDMDDMKWSKVSINGRDINLYAFSACFMDDHTIFIFGGTNIYQNRIETFSNVAYLISLTTKTRKDSEQMAGSETGGSKQMDFKSDKKKKEEPAEQITYQEGLWNRIYATGEIPGRIFHGMVKIENKIFVFGGNKDPNMYTLEFRNIEVEFIAAQNGLRGFYDPEILPEPKDEADISVIEENKIKETKQKKKEKKDLYFGPSKNVLSAISTGNSKLVSNQPDTDILKTEAVSLSKLGDMKGSGSMGGSDGSKSGNVLDEDNPDIEHLKRADINAGVVNRDLKKKKAKKKKK